jgi:DNA-binding protein HU-beta
MIGVLTWIGQNNFYICTNIHTTHANMNKKELIREVVKDTGITENDVRTVLNSMTDIIQKSLMKGLDVNIKNLVKFEKLITKARKARDIRTGAEIEVPKRYRIKVSIPEAFRRKIIKQNVY